jgi:DNA-directed RNA polymerase subunit RPC12/RpoP
MDPLRTDSIPPKPCPNLEHKQRHEVVMLELDGSNTDWKCPNCGHRFSSDAKAQKLTPRQEHRASAKPN